MITGGKSERGRTPQGGPLRPFNRHRTHELIRSWSGADIGSRDIRMTATFTSAVGELVTSDENADTLAPNRRSLSFE